MTSTARVNILIQAQCPQLIKPIAAELYIASVHISKIILIVFSYTIMRVKLTCVSLQIPWH